MISIFLCYLFIHVRIFLAFRLFLIHNNVYPKYCQYYKKMTIKELKDFIYENIYRQIGFPKENSYYSMKHQKKKDLLLLQLN